VDWPERLVVPEADCSVVLVGRRRAVRAEAGQDGYLVVLADWVGLEADCWVVPVERRWAVRAEVGQDGYLVVLADWLVVLADWVGLEADCWVVPVQRRWGVRAGMAAGQTCYQVAPADWVGPCDSRVGLTESSAVQEVPSEHWVLPPAGLQLPAAAPESVQGACHRCSESLAVDG
jgi:hypothetical protein